MQWIDFSGMIKIVNKGEWFPGGQKYGRREKAVGLFLYAMNNKEIHESLASNPRPKRRVFELSVKKKSHSGASF